ncbi:HEAT repeat domain-containing protein [Croceitalea rosinachiae]|uniref:HEAT repeat domain-containing protein n=1 Tax=Croceitalea rosinachiae TaxID=3075596 RepID=A0ABU3ABJ2_9FLAO|nr:HEAT repeat domain-containing protein [Croceitalea sp. F388]MDT0607534.1 HEAT repeat domain-containing protein [Croceitalea sp. F388]
MFSKRKNKRYELAPIISNFLFHSPQDPKEEQKEYVELKIKIREYLSSKYFRTILADILFDLQKDVAGGTRQRLFKLYVELGLHHDSYKKLASWRWNIVSQGILELSQMKVSDAFHFISKFVNDKRGVVRKQAEISIVSLKSEGINYLLDTTKYAISEWQQLKLIEALGSIENYRPPKFKAWLISPNKDVVLFCLRLIKHFNQNEASESIAELVKHKNDEVKIAAVLCIKDFNFSEHLDILKKVFWKCSALVKVEILNTISQVGDEGDLMFLHEIGRLESNFAVVNRAHGAINTISPDSILPTKDIIENLASPITKSISGLYDLDFLEIEVEFTEVVIKEDAEIETKEIEVDEIEIYDLLEKHTNTREQPPKEIPEKPDFAIEEMEHELDKSLNNSLGLLDIKESDDNKDLTEVQNDYTEMSSEERNKFIDTIESVGDKREIQLLEFIMENEDDTELRFRAFNTLKQVGMGATKKVPTSITSTPRTEAKSEFEASEIILPEHSIFYELYQYASDNDSKEILIKEIIAVGDKKEIPFLEQLCRTESNNIQKLAKKAIKQINKISIGQSGNANLIYTKNEDQENIQHDISEMDFNDLQSLLDETKVDPSMQKRSEDERIPLELCFLYDELGILYGTNNKKEDLGLNFELSREYEVMVKTENIV